MPRAKPKPKTEIALREGPPAGYRAYRFLLASGHTIDANLNLEPSDVAKVVSGSTTFQISAPGQHNWILVCSHITGVLVSPPNDDPKITVEDVL